MKDFISTFRDEELNNTQLFEKNNIPLDVITFNDAYVKIKMAPFPPLRIPNIPVYLNNRLYDLNMLSFFIQPNQQTSVMKDPIDHEQEISWSDIKPAWNIQQEIAEIIQNATLSFRM